MTCNKLHGVEIGDIDNETKNTMGWSSSGFLIQKPMMTSSILETKAVENNASMTVRYQGQNIPSLYVSMVDQYAAPRKVYSSRKDHSRYNLKWWRRQRYPPPPSSSSSKDDYDFSGGNGNNHESSSSSPSYSALWRMVINPHSWHQSMAYILYVKYPVRTGLRFFATAFGDRDGEGESWLCSDDACVDTGFAVFF